MIDIFNKTATAFLFAAIAGLFAASSSATAQTAPATASASPSSAGQKTHLPGNIHTTAVPVVRITAKVDDSKRVMVHGHVPGALRRAMDMGHLASSTPAQNMIMVLQSSEDQKRELRRVLDEQQDKQTANYHQWLTPEQFGDHFGVHDADIAAISAWLKSQGFQVGDVSKSRRVGKQL
jgi:hypothetical protein